MNRSLRFAAFVAMCLLMAYMASPERARQERTGQEGANRQPAPQTRTERKSAEPRSTATKVVPSKITGRVVAVLDGDSIQVLADGSRRITVRLEGIDAPERGQAFGNRAREHLTKMCRDKVVTVDVSGEDQYDRSLGVARIGDEEINAAMVRDGFAWRYLHSERADLGRLEAEARREGRGLWRDKNPTPPWTWRRENQDNDR